MDALGDKVSGIEADTELANHGDISTGAKRLHEALQRCVRMMSWAMMPERKYLRPGLGNSTEVVDHVGLGHADAAVADGENLIIFVRNYTDEEVLLVFEDRRVSEGGVANFVQRVGAIGDDFTEENLFVRVEGV